MQGQNPPTIPTTTVHLYRDVLLIPFSKIFVVVKNTHEKQFEGEKIWAQGFRGLGYS